MSQLFYFVYRFPYFVSDLRKFLFIDAEISSGQDHEETVADITKHDGKQEREGDNGE